MGKNTRVAVPLSEEAYDAISKISEITGISRGRFVADTLEAAIPSFIAIADAYRMAEQVQGAERDAVLNAMKQAEERLLASLGAEVPFKMDGHSTAISGASAAPSRNSFGEGVVGASHDADPPIANRGVHNSDKGGQQ